MNALTFYVFVSVFNSADWYKDRLTDKQLDELENPPPPSTEKPKIKKGSSRRKHPKLRQREEEEAAAETVEE